VKRATRNLPGRFKSKTALKNHLDELFRRQVRAKGYCQAAGLDHVNCGGVLQTAHIEGRRNFRLRWEPLNALCLCAGHHRWYSDQPIAWATLIEREFPESWAFVAVHRWQRFDGDYAAVLERLRGAA
jgi:hypothetical protein